MNQVTRVVGTAVVLAGCPAPCGTVTLGGGEVALTLTPEGGAPWVATVPGVEHPGAAYHRGGAWLERWVDDGFDTVELGIDRRIEGDDLPCGDTAAQLSVLASMDTTWQDTVWVTLDLMTDDGLVLLSGSGYAGRELLDADADGSLTTTLIPSVADPGCEAFRSQEWEWELTLDWSFDPERRSDDVALCY